jgi:hypothetical protein
MPIEGLPTPEKRFEDLPGWAFSSRYIVDLPEYEALRMHYVDEWPGDADVTMLCVHKTPSWPYVYRRSKQSSKGVSPSS